MSLGPFFRKKRKQQYFQHIESFLVVSLLIDLMMIILSKSNILRLLMWFMPLGKALIGARILRKVVITLSVGVEIFAMFFTFSRQGKSLKRKLKLVVRLWRKRIKKI